MAVSDQDLEDALRAADKAGNVEDARKLAEAIVARRSAAPAASKPPSFMQRFKRAVYVPQNERQDKTFGAAVSGGITGIPDEIATEAVDAAKQVGRDILPTSLSDLHDLVLGGVPGIPGSKGALDMVGLALSPVTGAATSAVGRPVEEATGVRREITGNLLTALIPVGGEAKIAASADRAAEFARLHPSTEYGQAVSKLLNDGVDLTPGQRAGGMVRRQEEALKSHPMAAQAVLDQEDRSIRSFINVAINRALSPIGARVAGSGRAAIKKAQEALSNAYERIKPELKVAPDAELNSDFAAIDKRVRELPESHQKQFEAIKDNHVLGPLTAGEMDGEQFKAAQSELSNLYREYRGSGSPADRTLAHRIQDLNEALSANMERNSAPGVKTRLQAINKAYAGMVRIENAASHRAGSLGHFSTGDLLAGVRKADSSVRKRSFAAGDAMMQDFAETAHQVLPNKLPDSGTAYRLRSNHDVLTATLGSLANPVTSGVIEGLKPLAGESKVVRNYLLSNALKTSPFVRRVPAVNTLHAITDQMEQQ